MDFFDVIERRRSTRSFLQTPIPGNKLRRVLAAANAAPSAGNLQSYEIYVVTAKRKREDLARAANEQLFVACAPVVLVFCADASRARERYGRRGTALYSVQDATIACSFAMLAAVAQGLGCVWVGAFDADRIRSILGAPRALVPVAMLPIGHAAERPRPADRRPLEDLTVWLN